MQFYPTLDSDSIRPYLPAHPMLLPASSWARQLRGPEGALPVPHIPVQVYGFGSPAEAGFLVVVSTPPA